MDLRFTCDEELKEAIRHLAKASERSMSQYLRFIVENHVAIVRETEAIQHARRLADAEEANRRRLMAQSVQRMEAARQPELPNVPCPSRDRSRQCERRRGHMGVHLLGGHAWPNETEP